MLPITGTLLNLLGSATPSLTKITKYYFLHPSKQLRPLVVLLFAQATNGLGNGWGSKNWHNEVTSAGSLIPPLLPTQMRLAQILEMIHVASLLHDDVIDKSSLRRGKPSGPAVFGNKLSVLGGDFILAQASAALSRLGDIKVVEIIASVIADLVDGEMLQTKVAQASPIGLVGLPSLRSVNWNFYMRRTYLKTASLIANGARAAVVLGGCEEGDLWREVAYAYGRNLGIAFQLVDDILDYEAGKDSLGKPGGADLQLGLATGPALYAWEEHPEMGPLIERKFEHDGDVEIARDFVRRSSGIERTRDLARTHANKAKEVIQMLPDSDAKISLEVLTESVVTRTH